jgi:hypothetical protein
LGLDIESDLYLDVNAGASFTHKTMTEQKKFLEHFLEKYTSVVETKPLQEKAMSSFEEPSSPESKPIPSFSLNSTHELSLEPRTPKEGVIHPSEFPIEFEDYGNTSNHFWHKKPTTPLSHPFDLPEEAFSKVKPSKEWLMEVKRFFEAI